MTQFARLLLPSLYRLVELENVDSTNAEAKRLGDAGWPDATLVWAKRQSAGRGRRGRAWSSPKGNLYFTILLRPDHPAHDAMQLGFVAANAVADAVAAVCPPDALVQVKWPNDVLVNGRKIAGLLIEAEPDPARPGHLAWLVLGIGVNVKTHPAALDTEYAATSLAAEGARGEGLAVEVLLAALAKGFLDGLESWRAQGFGPVREQWLKRAKGLGGPVIVRLANETIQGVFAALDEDGAMILRQDGRAERRITAGDVFFPESA